MIDITDALGELIKNIDPPVVKSEYPVIEAPPMIPVSVAAPPAANCSSLHENVARAAKPSHKHHHRASTVPAHKRSFRDYTKPIKRGFLNRQIPTHDVRRNLAQILIHNCNYHDPLIMENVLRTFCGSSVVMTSRFIGNAELLPFKPVIYRELHGVPNITKYINALYLAVPDGVLKLLDSKVHMFQNGCSYIVGKFTFNGSKLYDLTTIGDSKEKRMLPSKFDRRDSHMNEYNQNSPTMSLTSDDLSSSFGGRDGMDNLSDLEAFLFDEIDQDDGLFTYSAGPAVSPMDSYSSVASNSMMLSQPGSEPQMMSVALESHPIEFVVSSDKEQIVESPLRFLGTISFYLDPDAKIFKIEVLNTVEQPPKEPNTSKRRRHHH